MSFSDQSMPRVLYDAAVALIASAGMGILTKPDDSLRRPRYANQLRDSSLKALLYHSVLKWTPIKDGPAGPIIFYARDGQRPQATEP